MSMKRSTKILTALGIIILPILGIYLTRPKGWDMQCSEHAAQNQSWEELKKSPCVQNNDMFFNNPNWRQALVLTHCPDDLNDEVYKDHERKEICKKAKNLAEKGGGILSKITHIIGNIF